MTKLEFCSLLKTIDISKDWGFIYDGNCTDPMTSRYWVSHMANYEFSLVCNETNENYTIESNKTSIPHFTNKEKLAKKYTKWADDFKKNPDITTELTLKLLKRINKKNK